jgi:diguanylate cyclase (GGDEF)-like protein
MHSGRSQLLLHPTGAPEATLPFAGSADAATTPSRARGLAARLTDPRPPIAWSLALLFLLKALICFAAVASPISDAQPRGLVALVGTLGVAAACGIWLYGSRIPVIGFELLLAAGTVVASYLVTHASTQGGMMVVALAFPWTAIYAAHFFPRRRANAQALLISAGFGVGLLLGNLSGVAIYWVIVTITIWSICIVLGNLSESMRRQLGTDALTGLLNRSGFLAAALRERAIANRTGAPLALAVIDLDDFKQINDREGHAAGDQLLETLARRWRERIRPSDVLARHGGDEFVLLLPATTAAGAQAALERLRDGADPVSWSVGISEWLPGEALDAPLARADRHLYAAKLATSETADDGPAPLATHSGHAYSW